jgi:8-oxo-dGTP pyrophosphatase MutT (NUDIX family)
MNPWEQMPPTELAGALRLALAGGLPGRAAQRAMGHRLSYGRHHGPVPGDARRAAVLLAVHPTAKGWSIPAILRPVEMRAHAGQVSLPGGMVEASESPEQCALREFEEELGASAACLEIIGELTPVYVFVSGFVVSPLVAVSAVPLTYRPNPEEVAAAIELPLASLADPANRGEHTIERRGLRFTVPHFAIAGQQIWGATSLILAEFAALFLAGTKPGPGTSRNA